MRQALTAAVASGVLLLVGCTAGEPDAAENANANAATPVAGSVSNLAGAVTADGSSTRTAASGGLRGQVSDLTGAVSGLNTRVSDMGLVIDLPADALFEFDKAELTPAAQTELAKAAELIRRSPPGAIQVIGHTDSKGDDAYNQKLSEARARTVADWFGTQVGVRQRAFEAIGKGETDPIAPNARPDGGDDAAGRAKNRRVEVVVPNGT